MTIVFLESPRLTEGSGSNQIPFIGGDIYEIKTTINNASNNAVLGYANIDINIATGKPHDNGERTKIINGLEVLDAKRRDEKLCE